MVSQYLISAHNQWLRKPILNVIEHKMVEKLQLPLKLIHALKALKHPVKKKFKWVILRAMFTFLFLKLLEAY